MEYFFRRHHQQLAVLGPLILFLTFVAKEELTEHWKTLAAAVTTAESNVSMRRDILQVYTEIDAVHYELTVGRVKPTLAKYPPDSPMRNFGDEPKYLVAGDYTQHELALLSSLSAMLPESKKLQEQLMIFTKDFERYDKECIGFFLGRKGSACRTIELRTAVDKFTDDVLANAKKHRDRSELLANAFGWLSMILYTLGSAVTFLARRYGIADHASEE